MQNGGAAPLSSYRVIILVYAALGLALGVLFNFVSPQVEVPANGNGNAKVNLLGLGKSSKTVIRLAALFSLDAFAGGFVVQSIVAYWFHVNYDVSPATLGAIFCRRCDGHRSHIRRVIGANYCRAADWHHCLVGFAVHHFGCAQTCLRFQPVS